MNKNGFTLIEIMIAIAVLSIGIVPFMMVLTQNLNATVDSKRRVIGSYYGKALAEEIKLKKFGTSTTAILTNTAIVTTDRNGVFDSVDNYNGYDEKVLGGETGIRDIEGNIIDRNYFRKVKIMYVDNVNFEEKIGATSGNIKKVIVETWTTEKNIDILISNISFFVSNGG